LPANATSHTDEAALPDVAYDYRLWAYAGSSVTPVIRDDGRIVVPTATTTTLELDLNLHAGIGSIGDQFGRSVAISGDQAIVGAPGKRSAFVYKRDSDGGWSQQVELFYEFVGFLSVSQFGSSVAISGDQAMVALRTQALEAGPMNRVRALFYTGRSNGQWTSKGGTGSFPFPVSEPLLGGSIVALDGSRAVIGAPDESSAGRVHVYARPDTTWGTDGVLAPSDGVLGDRFGASVSVSGDWCIAGAAGRVSAPGAAYVFKRTGASTWTQVAKLTDADAPGDGFGQSVAIGGDRVIVGAPGDGAASSVYVHANSGDTWTRTNRGERRRSRRAFGVSVASMTTGLS
jgi:hypothetical protein